MWVLGRVCEQSVSYREAEGTETHRIQLAIQEREHRHPPLSCVWDHEIDARAARVPAAVLTYFKKIVIVEDFLLTGRKCPIVNTKEMFMDSNNQPARIALRVDEAIYTSAQVAVRASIQA